MIIEPKVRGFICTTAHPTGCFESVKSQVDYVKSQEKCTNGPKNVLVIGASTGYGLASRIVSTFACDAKTIGVFFEKPAAGKRTASAGWYNSAAFEQLAHAEGYYAKSLNGDAFSNEMKQAVIDLIRKDLGQIDLIVYSLAAPRRKDPESGEVYQSTLKPIAESYQNKTVDPMSGAISDVALSPAEGDDVDQTIAVMGGDDWALWIDALNEAGVLADGATTCAYSYVGPSVTHPIYKDGTIGRAKDHLLATAKTLNSKLSAKGGRAFVSVNKALVTQASSAIPVVPLYMSILFKLMKEQGTHEGCIEQIYRLFHGMIYTNQPVVTDEEGRVRIDDLEMAPEVQEKVASIWQQVNTENVDMLTDIAGYREDFYRLFGFSWPGVDYHADVDAVVAIPSLEEVES